ncbi:carbohydrate kinase [Chryseobacterium sp. POL2]|uniref:carbohydrate kinase family protein n=1 Tax=Chryseobacterium sp. POL2 TaxID=2713414 RepID=UPI0013E1EDBB|nr:carbohydrate kinase [Chryseobacterium sp. POL2]QIG90445.1 carbohydrate kinase [Chryseobacterium sp. POL2]
MRKAICFGEVLWDIFPNGKVIGGAPLHVAARLSSLGVPSRIVSKIGNDAAGRTLLEHIQNLNLTGVYIKIDQDYPTGEAIVKFDENSEAFYDIKTASAWDNIELTKEIEEAVSAADIFVYGSLAARGQTSKETLHELLKKAKYKVFDVNVRKPYCDFDEILFLMRQADLIKLNEIELRYLVRHLGAENESLELDILFLSDYTETSQICVTRGLDGAVLLSGENLYSHPGYDVEVVDTIGSGDNFLAALLSKIQDCETEQDFNDLLAYASAVGAVAATKKGPASRIDKEEVLQLIQGQLS